MATAGIDEPRGLDLDPAWDYVARRTFPDDPNKRERLARTLIDGLSPNATSTQRMAVVHIAEALMGSGWIDAYMVGLSR